MDIEKLIKRGVGAPAAIFKTARTFSYHGQLNLEIKERVGVK